MSKNYHEGPSQPTPRAEYESFCATTIQPELHATVERWAEEHNGDVTPQERARMLAAIDRVPWARPNGERLVETALRLVCEQRAKESRAPNTETARESADSGKAPRASHGGPGKRLRANLLRLSDVVPVKVRWLWDRRIPYGKLSILDGDPELGKSIITADLGARVTTGAPMPGSTERRAPGNVVIIASEDAADDTIRPRFDAAGGDPARAVIIVTVHGPDGESSFGLPQHAEALRDVIINEAASLVIIDPIMAVLRTDAHKDQDVRRALEPLARIAEETGAAILALRHLNKSIVQPALYRGGGSIGIVATARAALMVIKAPDATGDCILAVYKSNLGRKGRPWRYRVTDLNDVGRVEWLGEADLDLDAALAEQGAPGERSARDEACAFVLEALAAGPLPSTELDRRAKDAGIAPATLRRARKVLDVVAEKDGAGHWMSRLRGAQPAEGAHPSGVSPFAPVNRPDRPNTQEKKGIHDPSEGDQTARTGGRDHLPHGGAR